MSGRLMLLAAIAALVAVVFEWRVWQREPAAPAAAGERPGYYLDGVMLREFGSDGRQRLALAAARAAESPGTGIVLLEQVRLDYAVPGSPGWQLSAREAQVPVGSDIVQLEGDVRMSGAAPDGQPAELRTGRLQLDTGAERARTDDEVTLMVGRHAMVARGLQADLKAGTVRLESQVHGRFLP